MTDRTTRDPERIRRRYLTDPMFYQLVTWMRVMLDEGRTPEDMVDAVHMASDWWMEDKAQTIQDRTLGMSWPEALDAARRDAEREG